MNVNRERNYILNEAGEPVPEPDLLAWARWFEAAGEGRRVAGDELDGCNVSTVFLGLDHSWRADGPPILFETMIFCADETSPAHEYQARYRTRAEALAGHARCVELVRAGRAEELLA